MLTQVELAKLVDSTEEEEEVEYSYKPSYIYKKKNYRWFKVYSVYWSCDCFTTTFTFWKVTIMKPFKKWVSNSIWNRLDTKCLYLVYKEWKHSRWFNVPYKNYQDEDRAFDSSMQALVKKAKAYLSRARR